jgi:hypothetical protein
MQISGLPLLYRLARFTVDPARQWLYDLKASKVEAYFAGQVLLSTRIAIVVLFQPKGIAKSFQFTLEHLRSENWSTIVVSNSPVSEEDKSFILENAAGLIVRPNVGYDFGAYRSGIRFLEKIGHKPEKLILMNDSTWFPLRENDTSLRRMEMTNAAMSGHIFKTELIKYKDHCESHLLMFNSVALSHPSWHSFWKKYVMSNDRHTTIMNGEIGISQAIITAGLEVNGLTNREQFFNYLYTLSETELKDLSNSIVFHDDKFKWKLEEILESEHWREEMLNLFSESFLAFSINFISVAMQKFEFGFVKKSKEKAFHYKRRKVLELENSALIPPLHPAVHDEMVALVESWDEK